MNRSNGGWLSFGFKKIISLKKGINVNENDKCVLITLVSSHHFEMAL